MSSLGNALILVDDSDTSRIAYTGSWGKYGSTQEHNVTTHGLAGPGSFTFSFNGTGVTAYGTVPSNLIWSPVSCKIDGTAYTGPTTTSGSQPIYNFAFCSIPSPSLSDGEHTLTVTANGGPNTYVYFDYILYNHTIGSGMDAAPAGSQVNVVMDDARTDRITYGGPNREGSWVLGGAPGLEFNTTTHGTAVHGATATFNFKGTAVQVYGTIGNDTPGSTIATYKIDSLPPVPFIQPTISDLEYQIRTFNSDTLDDGDHTLTITGSPGQGDPQNWLDFIVYTASRSDDSVFRGFVSGSTGSSPGTSILQPEQAGRTVTRRPLSTSGGLPATLPSDIQPPSGTGLQTSVTLALQPSDDPRSQSENGSPSSSHTGLIVGITIGAVLIGLSAIVGLLLLSSRHRRRINAARGIARRGSGTISKARLLFDSRRGSTASDMTRPFILGHQRGETYGSYQDRQGYAGESTSALPGPNEVGLEAGNSTPERSRITSRLRHSIASMLRRYYVEVGTGAGGDEEEYPPPPPYTPSSE